jgi:LPS export ABC transporter protein LptC
MAACSSASRAKPSRPSTLDGHGLKLLLKVGILPLVITGRDSPAVRRRVADLGLPHALYGVHDKLAAAEPLLASLGVAWPTPRPWATTGRTCRCCGVPALACAPAECPRRGAGDGAPRHHRARRPGCGARVLRPAADGGQRRYAGLLAADAQTLDGPLTMTVELHLPDLPEVPITLGPVRPSVQPARGSPALAPAAARHLVVLPAAAADGAAGAGHLVAGEEHAATAPRPETTAVRSDPDYTMTHFVLERFDTTGRLRLRVRASACATFPTPTAPRSTARIRAFAPTAASRWPARRALANGDLSEVQLLGGAQVVSRAAGDRDPRRVPACLPRHRAVRSHLPVRVNRGRNAWQAGGMDYDHGQRRLDWQRADARRAGGGPGGTMSAPRAAVGLHHRGLQRHRAGAGGCATHRPAGGSRWWPAAADLEAWAAARAGRRGSGRSTPPTCSSSTASSVPAPPALDAAGPARRGDRQCRHQRGHGHRRACRPRRDA